MSSKTQHLASGDSVCALIAQQYEYTLLNTQSLLSASLLLAQMNASKSDRLTKVMKMLDQMEASIKPELEGCYLFARELLTSILANNRPAQLLSNNLQNFLF